ncbi:hypothetical protein AB1Y20_014227 [Prymnesium parvum]|uniref:Peroxisomal membrane protein MPV17 n=1 Tax=Prymnesium parvum TaxID=97485 RepID=A0AB34IH26_PRYPA
MLTPRPVRQVFFVRMLHGRGVCRLGPPHTIAAGVAAVGDLLSQLVVESRDVVERRRLLVCTLLGCTVDGVVVQRWFQWVHALHNVLGVQLTLHHAVFAPVLLIPAWIGGTALLESNWKPWHQLNHEWRLATQLHCVTVGPCQALNALVVPKRFSVLACNTVGIVWSTCLSWICHKHASGPGAQATFV